jgi:copper chaperone CopZ
MHQTFEVANIRCGGCANTIRTALDNAGFTSVRVDLLCDPRKVSAEIEDEVQLQLFKEILRNHGYPLVDEKIGFLDATSLKAKSFVSCAVGKFNKSDEQE